MNIRSMTTAAFVSATLASGAVLAAAPAGATAPSAAPAPASLVRATATTTATTTTATPGTAFTAYGSNWRVVVNKGRMTTEGRGVGQRTMRVKRSAFAKGVEFTGRHKRTPFTLVIRSGRCIDTAGHNTGMVSRLYVGKRTYRGCAVAGAVPYMEP